MTKSIWGDWFVIPFCNLSSPFTQPPGSCGCGLDSWGGERHRPPGRAAGTLVPLLRALAQFLLSVPTKPGADFHCLSFLGLLLLSLNHVCCLLGSHPWTVANSFLKTQPPSCLWKSFFEFESWDLGATSLPRLRWLWKLPLCPQLLFSWGKKTPVSLLSLLSSQ